MFASIDRPPNPALPPIVVNLDDGVSLDEATILAVAANPVLRASRAKRGLAAAQVIESGILPNPTLSIGVDVPAFGATAGAGKSERLGLGWEITALVPRSTSIRSAELHVREIELDIAWQEWQIVIEARLQWRRVVALQTEIVVAEATRADLQKISETLAQAQASRDATAVEASSARAALDEATLAHKTLERELAAARRSLDRALGLRLDVEVKLDDSAETDFAATPLVANLIATLRDRRLDLVALRWAHESLEARVRAAVLSRLPRIGIDLGVARDNAGVGTVGFGLTLDLPVFDRAQGRVAVARASRAELSAEYEARVFTAHADLDDAYADLVVARDTVALVEAAMPRLERLVTTYRAALAEHLVDVPSVYAAIRDLNLRRLDVLRRRRELGDLVTAIELASGRLIDLTPSLPRSNR